MSLLPHYKVSHNKALISSIDKLAGYAQCPRPTDRKQTDSLSSKLHICRENKSTSTISKCLGGRSASICGNLCSLEEFKTKIQREKDLQELKVFSYKRNNNRITQAIRRGCNHQHSGNILKSEDDLRKAEIDLMKRLNHKWVRAMEYRYRFK
jgi:hypothetical protein